MRAVMGIQHILFIALIKHADQKIMLIKTARRSKIKNINQNIHVSIDFHQNRKLRAPNFSMNYDRITQTMIASFVLQRI